ncbi:MAG TPA: hypothetical protein VLA82_14815 [Actinomycetota bacterium]|nr:hypothetical protein [Actinomycetota bacterium]
MPRARAPFRGQHGAAGDVRAQELVDEPNGYFEGSAAARRRSPRRLGLRAGAGADRDGRGVVAVLLARRVLLDHAGAQVEVARDPVGVELVPLRGAGELVDPLQIVRLGGLLDLARVLDRLLAELEPFVESVGDVVRRVELAQLGELRLGQVGDLARGVGEVGVRLRRRNLPDPLVVVGADRLGLLPEVRAGAAAAGGERDAAQRGERERRAAAQLRSWSSRQPDLPPARESTSPAAASRRYALRGSANGRRLWRHFHADAGSGLEFRSAN